MSKSLTKEDLLTNPMALYMMTGFPDFSIQTRGYELLKNMTSMENNINNKINTRISTFYKTNLLEIRLDQEFLSTELKDNYLH